MKINCRTCSMCDVVDEAHGFCALTEVPVSLGSFCGDYQPVRTQEVQK